MADPRIPSRLTPPAAPAARPMNPARAEAVMAAQRAFFQAALTGAEIQPPAPPARTEAKAAAEPARPSSIVRELPEGRILRPGSLVDIRV